MTVRAALAFAFLLALAPAARADESCSALTQMDMNACAGRNFDAADARLNGLWKQVTARLAGNADAKAEAVAAQRAWIAFRDAECTFAASGVEGGSIYPTIWAECRRSLTEERSRTLSGYLVCQEGDLSCPLP